MSMQALSQGISPAAQLPRPAASSGDVKPFLQPAAQLRSQILPSDSKRRSVRQHASRRDWKLMAADIATAAPSKSSPSQAEAVEILKVAAGFGGIPTQTVADAIRVLEKAKIKPDDCKKLLGGDSSPGRSWRLVFTSGAKDTQKAFSLLEKGGGAYFPITAVQRWDSAKDEIVNGIFLGHLASLKFKGPFEWDGKRLPFDFKSITLKFGPLQKEFKLPSDFGKKKEKTGPFFTFIYADDEIVVLRGRGGGVGLWARTTPAWDLQAGVV